MFNLSSGKPGGLVLVTTGQNVAFVNTALARSLKARIEAGDTRLQREYDAARAAHGDGVADWHDVVLYIKQHIAFIYDPSALSVGNTSASGREILRRVQEDDVGSGIDAKMLANINTAARLWGAAYGPGDKCGFGKTSTAAGGWIGGGGNYGDDCRQMCATFIVVVHALQWPWECGRGAGLSESPSATPAATSTGCWAA
jgi:hypothetical protein